MEIHSAVHKLFHAYRQANTMVLIRNMLRYTFIGTSVLEETAASIFRASYPETVSS
jgi:hypothetical protein